MKTNTKSNSKVAKIVGIGLFTAIVVVLQLVGSAIHFGVFSISLVLAPIIIGTALYGIGAGAWLGLIFGVTVLLSGDAGAFLAINPVGTVLTVLVKGTCAGLGAGVVFKLFEGKNKLGATIVAGIVSPICNTGIFLIGCYLFFIDTIAEWGKGAGFENVTTYILTAFVGTNFLVELAINLVLASAIVKIIEIGKKQLKK